MVEKQRSRGFDRRRLLLVVCVLIVAAVILLLTIQLLQPQRSVANYCKVYADEKTRLSKLPGDTYPSGVFREELSDAGEIAKSYGKLARVAPAEIQKDVEILEESYKQISSSSSNFLSAGFASIAPNQAVIDWTDKNCKE